MEKKKLQIITMRDAPVKPEGIPEISKPITTHDIFNPEVEYPKNPREPAGPMITTGNVEQIREQAAMRSRMEKARAARMEKIKQELEAKAEAEKKKEKAKPKPKLVKKPEPETKKAPESEPEAKPEVASMPEDTEKEAKPDPLKEAVETEIKKTSVRKKYTTKKKESEDK